MFVPPYNVKNNDTLISELQILQNKAPITHFPAVFNDEWIPTRKMFVDFFSEIGRLRRANFKNIKR